MVFGRIFICRYLFLLDHSPLIINQIQYLNMRIGLAILLYISMFYFNQVQTNRNKINNFGKQIKHENLYHQQIQKQYRVGGVKIGPGWLQGSSPPLYRANLKSSFELTELTEKLYELKQKSADNPINMFQIAELQKKVQNFQVEAMSPKKKHKEHQFQVHSTELILHKLNEYWGLYSRKCHIENNQIRVVSEKDKKEKIIDIAEYTMELQSKTQELKAAKKFQWPQKLVTRLVLHGDKLRTYCIYGQERELKEIIKKNRIKKTNVNKIDFLESLNEQYFNKVIVSFGNKLRIFTHLIKERERIRDSVQLSKSSIRESENGNQLDTLKTTKINPHGSDIISPQQSSNLSNKKSHTYNTPTKGLYESSVIRMKKRSTIHYNQLEKEDKIYQSPDFEAKDINLNIKQVADSEEDLYSIRLQENNNSLESDHEHQSISHSPKHSEDAQMILQLNQNIDESSSDYQSFLTPENRGKTRKQSQGLLSNIQVFEIQRADFTHQLHVGYFESYLPYSQSQITFIICQFVIPEVQYQNMPNIVNDYRQVVLVRSESNPNIYITHQQETIKCTSKFNEFMVVLEHGLINPKHLFHVDLKKIHSEVDESQFLYFKCKNEMQENQNIICGGKLKLGICEKSQNCHTILRELSTVSFLEEFIKGKSNIINKKYKFINYKKKDCEIRQQWNYKMMNKIVNKSNHKQFEKVIFFTNCSKFISKVSLKNRLTTTTFSQTSIEDTELIPQNMIVMADFQISKTKANNIRNVISTKKLIKVMGTLRKNKAMEQRFNSLKQFIRMKHGIRGEKILVLGFVVEVIRKLENILSRPLGEKQIIQIIQEYLGLEYELDDLFGKISAYFSE